MDNPRLSHDHEIYWLNTNTNDNPAPRRSKRLTAYKIAKLPRESTGVESQKFEPKVLTLFNHVLKRELYGYNHIAVKKVVQKHLSTSMPYLFKEHVVDIGSVNKVFASQWVNDHMVVMGSKCNKIMVKDVTTNELVVIPSLKSASVVPTTDDSNSESCQCGIHSIDINPSKTLLATGAENTSELAIYRLPSFEPVFLGQNAHSDWIFDIKWVDDQYCVTGSRDSKLALWKIKDENSTYDVSDFINYSEDLPVFPYKTGEPSESKSVPGADKIRALAYNKQAMELGILSLNSKVHTWDVNTFQLRETKKLPYARENVCMTYDSSRKLYAVGSQSNVTLLDRDLKQIFNIVSLQKGYGIRSVSFNNNILTIGTGYGSILFYDLNAGDYIRCACGQERTLKASQGYLLKDNTWRDVYSAYQYNNAIYTHCYDETGTRLFAAGGPLPAVLYGNYAGLWS